MLIEMHIIQNHSPSNLNRDDMGNPKSCIFGGVSRARISSQCLKRAVRRSDLFKNEIKGMGQSYQTRALPKLIFEGLKDEGVDSKIAEIIGKKFAKIGKSTKSKTTKKSSKKSTKKKNDESLQTKQVLFFSNKEIDNIVLILKGLINGKNEEEIEELEFKKIQAKLAENRIAEITPDMGLFGRMTTSDEFINIDSAIQVAHAISTHRFEKEYDYFVAIDELIEKGSGMLGETMFTSSCFYKYYSLDTDGLLNNLGFHDSKDKTGQEILKKIITGFIRATVLITPSGYQNSFAANQLPDGILVNIRSEKIPISYANAFLKPVHPTRNEDLVEASIKALGNEVKKINDKYNPHSLARLWFTLKDLEIPDTTKCKNFDNLLESIFQTIEG